MLDKQHKQESGLPEYQDELFFASKEVEICKTQKHCFAPIEKSLTAEILVFSLGRNFAKDKTTGCKTILQKLGKVKLSDAGTR